MKCQIRNNYFKKAIIMCLSLILTFNLCGITAFAASSTMSINGFSMPNKIAYGTGYTLTGNIKSNLTISSVTIDVLSSSGSIELSKTVSNSSTIFAISKIDQYLTFNKLSVGNKTIRVLATDSDGQKLLYQKGFEVVKPKVAGNSFTKKWLTYKSDFQSAATTAGIDVYILAAYSANECNFNQWQFTKYAATNSSQSASITINDTTYTNVKYVNGAYWAAVGLTSVQSQYNTGYTVFELLNVDTNLRIGASEFKTAASKYTTIHDIVGRVHNPSNINSIDSMTNYAGTSKTYWQVFVDNYNNLRQQDGLSATLSY